MAGNGVKMTVATTAAKEKTKKTTTTRKTPRGRAVKKAKDAPVKEARQERVDGLEMLRQSADRHLARDADELTEEMSKRARKGKLDIAKVSGGAGGEEEARGGGRRIRGCLT